MASIDFHEKKAESIYEDLVSRYPRSVIVLRSQAMFFEDVKQEAELADSSYKIAEDMDEENTRKNKRFYFHLLKFLISHKEKRSMEFQTPQDIW